LLVLTGTDSEDLYTFPASTKGTLGAVGELCKAYGKRVRLQPDEYPVIKLGVSSSLHKKRAYGRIKYPILEVVGWTPKGPAMALPEGGGCPSAPPAGNAPPAAMPPPASEPASAPRF